MQGVAIRFRTDQNNQRYGFGLTITREMTKTKSSPEGINVFFYLIKFLIIDVYINLCLFCPETETGADSQWILYTFYWCLHRPQSQCSKVWMNHLHYSTLVSKIQVNISLIN